MTVCNSLCSNQLSQWEYLIEIVAGDYRVDIDDESEPERSFEFSQQSSALQRLFEIARHAPHQIVRFTKPVKSDIDVKFELLILRKTMLGDFEYAVRFAPVRRQVDVANAIIANEEVDDLGQFPSERRLATTEPQICKWRRVLRELHNLFPREIAFLVQLIPIEARLARRVAVGGDKKN